MLLLPATVALLAAKVPRNVAVLDHVPERLAQTLELSRAGHSLNLAAHGKGKERAEVDEEDGPVDGHVRSASDRAKEGNDGGLGGRVPELKLRQTTDEGTELLIVTSVGEAREEATDAARRLGLASRQSGSSFLDVLLSKVVGQTRVEARLEEGKEQVEDVDGKRV